jgi:hypothetical protein
VLPLVAVSLEHEHPAAGFGPVCERGGVTDAGFPVALISPCELANTHGTGVQMLRLFGDGPRRFVHVHWASHSTLAGQRPDSQWLREPTPWPWRTGRRFIRRVRDRVGLSWWPGGVVNARRFRRLVQSLKHRPQAAYVVVSGEDDARRALSLLDLFGIAPVPHVWDLDRDELEPSTMPALGELLRRAPRVLALNESIAEQLRRFGSFSVDVVPFVSGHSAGSGWREPVLVLSGSLGPRPHNGHLPIVAEALRQLRADCPAVRAVYFGAHSHRIPHELRSEIEDLGLISDDACGDVLARARLACLVTPDGNSCWDRHSIPSRIADYLACGLPILAMITRGNATHDLLSDPALRNAVRFTETADELVDAARVWLAEEPAWARASADAVTFAERHFSLAVVRNRVNDALAGAAATRCASTGSR